MRRRDREEQERNEPFIVPLGIFVTGLLAVNALYTWYTNRPVQAVHNPQPNNNNNQNQVLGQVLENNNEVSVAGLIDGFEKMFPGETEELLKLKEQMYPEIKRLIRLYNNNIENTNYEPFEVKPKEFVELIKSFYDIYKKNIKQINPDDVLYKGHFNDMFNKMYQAMQMLEKEIKAKKQYKNLYPAQPKETILNYRDNIDNYNKRINEKFSEGLQAANEFLYRYCNYREMYNQPYVIGKFKE
ncbi:MAG: hypothetical protein J0H68_01695 [Sphingobacteriia bacterium]|nr:hypothetical protein [Sphingobacteriia bacterium]